MNCQQVTLPLLVLLLVALLMLVPGLAAQEDDDPLRIGLVTHEGGEIDDRGFNQSVWLGIVTAAENLEAEADYIETRDSTDYADNIAIFAEAGYDVVVTVGIAMGEATQAAAQAYQDVFFIGADQFATPDAPFPPNMVGLVFHEDEAGYLAGALAGLLTDSDVVAGIYGTDLAPSIVAFATGFANGVSAVNPEAEVITTYHPGGFGQAFNDPEWGATTAAQAIDQRADVVFAAGGATGFGVLTEVANRTTEDDPLFCIGVDTDQWETVPEARDCLVSSAVKRIAAGIETIIVLLAEGEPPTGNYYGPVDLADFHDFAEIVPQNVQDELSELAEALAAGEIDTGYVISGLDEEETSEVGDDNMTEEATPDADAEN